MPLNIGGNIISSTGIVGNTFKNIIATNGLVLHLDAANVNSYPGTGAVWNDLSGFNNNVNINGSPSWTTVGGRTAFNFLSDGDYMLKTGFIGCPTTEITLEAWLYPGAAEITAGDRGTVILISSGSAVYMSWTKSSQYLSNYWYTHSPEGYHESNGPSSRSAWHYWCSVWDNRDVYQWVDGTLGKVNGVTGTSTANTTLNIGREGSSRQFSGGIAIVRIYNRALNPYEVVENYYAQKTRFGL